MRSVPSTYVNGTRVSHRDVGLLTHLLTQVVTDCVTS
jgi:hypothetical protein